MRRALRRVLAAAAFALAGAAGLPPAGAAAPAREVHGQADAFAKPGIALAWGILRGADEAATQVVLRIAADPAMWPRVAVAGVDPFTQARVAHLAAAPNPGTVEVRIARTRFADVPRTEITLYGIGDAPALILYFVGVPDTAPEVTSEAALAASLADRMTRAKNNPAKP